MLVMLLCQWAVSPNRAGEHRPLVAARVLLQRQTEVLKVRCKFVTSIELATVNWGQSKVMLLHIPQGEDWRDTYNLETLDESWEEDSTVTCGDVTNFPFQSMLFKFLDTRAPLPSK